MSGENQRDDDPDFLDDDFIIEDIAAKNEDLDSLFEQPAGGTPAATEAAAPDAEDLLFTDHSREPTFEGRAQFAEDDKSSWDGKALDLGALEGEIGEAKSTPADPALAAAEQSFTKELDSLLKGEEAFGPDAEGDLEVIGADPTAAADGIAEFEQSGPFVLDDGEGVWQDEKSAEAPTEETTEVELGVSAAAAAATDGDGEVEPGWEPLPAASVDELAEVGDVERTDEEGDAAPLDEEAPADAQEHTVPGFGGRHAPALVGAEVEGHDIYAEEQAVEVVGTKELRRRSVRVFASLAASLTILAAGAVIVWKPQWLGMVATPERTQQVEVTRPTVAVTVPVPEIVADPIVNPPQPDKPTVATGPGTEPVVPPPAVVETTPPAPVQPPDATEPAPPVVATTEPVVPVPPPSATEPAPAVVPAPAPDNPIGWPVREASPPVAQQAPTTGKPNLIRVNEELLIGEPDGSMPARGKTAEGVMPGSRAFAQLSNGNYFIGSVKNVDSERLTLNVGAGEVTLPVAALVRLTELGSADYTELQRVTSGFVRLTNNNRLVGGILSGIADDHVVLEFRSNRVMLPRSAVGQVVQGEGDAGVRLDTTREEDDWLRRVVERQVGNGAPPVPPAPAPVPPAGRSPR